jgi:tRNA (guanine37-N1)-methyltransferase
MEEKHRSFNVFGNIALVNFPDDYKQSEKKKFAMELLKKHKAINTVLEKSGNFKGRLRKQETKWLAGEKSKEVLYRENGCVFRFNIDETYFSTRLANERMEVVKMVKPNDEVFAMFAGISPFPIVIAKNTKVKKIYSNELNRKANDYAEINIKKNKVQDKIELVPGDVKRVSKKFAKDGKKFDLILMTRPNLEDSFLDCAFSVSKSGTRIYYHAFCHVDEKEYQIRMIRDEAKKFGFDVKIISTKDIGDIAPGKVRFRILFEVYSAGSSFSSTKTLSRQSNFWKICFDLCIVQRFFKKLFGKK